MSIVELPRDELAELRAENASLREALTAQSACRMFERFHAFDAIKDDSCPCCGGRVAIEETPNSVKLKALDNGTWWLREGLELALKHLQADRKSLAIDAIKGTLSGETW